MERQFRRHFEAAERLPGATGENFLRILEMRFDNLVYRLGLASSRPEARQLINHGHFHINGKKVDIPSYICKPGEVISVREDHRGNEFFKVLAEELKRREMPAWLQLDARNMSGRIVSQPNRADLDVSISEQLIVEFYSR
jgi:small subunit ribosomal protein S4